MSSKTNSNSRCFAELQSHHYHYFLEFCRAFGDHVSLAGVAQLVEHHLAKVDVEGSNPFARSILFFKDRIQFPFELSPANNNIAEIIW